MATKTPRKSDNPLENASRNSLELQARPKPFVWTTAKGKDIVFPDLVKLNWREADELMQMFSRAINRTASVELAAFFERLLDAEDLALLEEDCGTYIEMVAVMDKVISYYFETFGTPEK